jgi:hypothetical protein
MMNFAIRDTAKSNLDKRDYQHLANNNGEGQMTESKLWGTAKTSYQQMGEAKLIVKHSQPVNYAHAAGRTLHIESIYVENSQGERFKYPVKHLNGARALATHVAHGGNPYDAIGTHITSLSEELNKLRMFKGYVDRNNMVSEAMGAIQTKVYERIDQVKKEIRSLQNFNYYESFAESFTASEAREIPEDLVNDWVDRLTIRTFNEELKNVFPYIYKLVGEEVSPVKELDPEDLLTDAYNPNSVAAQHARDLKAHHRAELKKKAEAGDETAKAMLKRAEERDEARRQEFNDRMERESYNPEDMDEAAKWRDPKYKGKLYTQEPEDDYSGYHDYYGDSRPENDPGEKHSTFDRSDNKDKLHYHYGDYQVGQKAKVGDRAKKGLLTKNSIRVVKDRIKGVRGEHPTPNLPEESTFESYLDSIMREESDLFNTDEEGQSTAIQTLNQLIAQEFPAGADGTNAIQSLKGVIDDQEFLDAIKQVGKVDPEMDIRDLLKGYLEKHDEQNGTDIASKINFDSTTPAPTAPTQPAEAPVPQEPPAAAPTAQPAAPAPVAEEKDDDKPPFDGPYTKTGDNDKDQFGNPIKHKARHLAKKGMADAIAKAKKAGATAETVINFGFGEMTLGEAIGKAGLNVEEFFESSSNDNEVVEFVKSMYDETTGNFPKGETGVLLAVEKQFGEGAAKVAHSVISELSHVYESKRLRQLAGLDEQFPMMDPDAMMKGMMAKMPNMDPAAMMKSQQDKIAQMKANMPQGGTNSSSYKVNGKPVSKQEYDAFMAQHPELGKAQGMLNKSQQPKVSWDSDTRQQQTGGTRRGNADSDWQESVDLTAMLRIAGLR